MAIYSPDEWKPLYIILQMIANQCWFYATWMNIHYIDALMLRMPTTLSTSFFFSDDAFHLANPQFYLILIELMLTCFVMVPIVVYISERAKKCLDFCSSIFIIHLFICFCISGLPVHLYWWITMLTYMVSMTLLCERIAVKRELEEILVSDILESV